MGADDPLEGAALACLEGGDQLTVVVEIQGLWLYSHLGERAPLLPRRGAELLPPFGGPGFAAIKGKVTTPPVHDARVFGSQTAQRPR